jgi:N-acetylmuramoyl-L-alanine amidase
MDTNAAGGRSRAHAFFGALVCPTTAQIVGFMIFNVRAVSAAAVSLFAIGALGTCAPATAVWAKDSPAYTMAPQAKSSLLPADVAEQAVIESNTPSIPALADEIEANIEQPQIKFAEPQPEPHGRSLAELVARHGATSTANREAECLAGAIYFESKGEPLDGQLAVAQVILNRAKSGRFPGSACGVVFQRSQFSFVRGGGFPPIARNSAQWKTAVAVAHIAKNDLWTSSVSNALFFHARRVSPGWRLKRIASVGNHVFYR